MIFRLIAFVVPLGLDTFAVSAALGLQRPTPAERLRISLVFGVVEGAVPAVGLLAGAVIGHSIGASADYLAGSLLIGYGLFAALRRRDDDGAAASLASARGWSLVVLGLSVSIDELAIGFTLGLCRVPVVPALLLIGAQAFAMAQLGIRLGARLSGRLRQRAEQLAGVVLAALGLVLVVQAAFG